MIPTIGRIVILHGLHSNGSVDHPAVITRAWGTQSTEHGPIAVNLTVFPDNAPPVQHSSVMLYHTPELAQEARFANGGGIVAHWPARA